ncbi:MAG TPA: aspartyl-phosphate phosphatase Spo0E family protein, partial [Pseudoneobacillus sp.]|nr:aspartyl-phosphate phosphatase Spo0E family protein [Pseudoneobacillus sp.]
MLNQLIEKTRIQMLEDAQLYGFTGNRTVQTSQELDRLLNWFQQKYIIPGVGSSEHYQVHGSIIRNIKSGLKYN